VSFQRVTPLRRTLPIPTDSPTPLVTPAPGTGTDLFQGRRKSSLRSMLPSYQRTCQHPTTSHGIPRCCPRSASSPSLDRILDVLELLPAVLSTRDLRPETPAPFTSSRVLLRLLTPTWLYYLGTSYDTPWPVIAIYLPGRIAESVRERYTNQLARLVKIPWTEQETRIMYDVQKRFGNKWTKIAEFLPCRSDNAIKNRWHNAKMMQRRAIRRLAATKARAAHCSLGSGPQSHPPRFYERSAACQPLPTTLLLRTRTRCNMPAANLLRSGRYIYRLSESDGTVSVCIPHRVPIPVWCMVHAAASSPFPCAVIV
jgi:hypothetical protein